MDKNVIKKYAVWAREQLIEKVTARAVRYEIIDGKEMDGSLESINGEILSDAEIKHRKALIQKIKTDGYGQVMEEVAYTWFNRFIAIRFMEVNGYLPSHIRVFSDENGDFKPQILTEALHLDLPDLNIDIVMQLKEASKEEELFKYLLKIQCNALNEILPAMFQKIEDYTELLLPDFLLRDGSVIEKLVNDIPEENFNVATEDGQIEVIGWMYQYYISAKHEEVVDTLHGKVVKKEEVPAATQLFTTDWVVRYLIDNSVGRYWIERNPESKLADELTYFVKPKNGVIKTIDEKITPQDVTVFDPCVGSGHFLVYAFEVLMKIYVEYGFSERDAASEIVKNNLFGLDIDGRATQLAYFAVMMKARQYDRRFFTHGIQPHIYEIMESNTVDSMSLECFYGDDVVLKKDVSALLNAMKDAKEYGSILQMPAVDFGRINERFEQLNGEISMYNSYLLGNFQLLIRPAEVMSGKYAVVATNPPYLNKYDSKLKDYINTNYREYNGDLYSVFMYRNFGYCVKNGYTGFMTPFVWMFIQTYEKMREYLMQNKYYVSLIQMEYSAFEEATVPICSFVFGNKKSDDKGYYFRLTDFTGGMEVQKQKILEAQQNKDCGYYYETFQNEFNRVIGSPVAYWASEQTLEAYQNPTVEKYMECKSGIMTGSDKYICLWHEASTENTKLNCTSPSDMGEYKWFPLNSGGDFRKWYGNNWKLVNLWHNGAEIKASVKNFRLRDSSYYFKKGITWGRITSSQICFREIIDGSLFGDAGPIGFIENQRKYVLGFLNSKVVKNLLQITNPTLNFQIHDIMSLPLCIDKAADDKVSNLVERNIMISQQDWDSFETSWDFARHPLVRPVPTVVDAYTAWQGECEDRFAQLKANEEELNRIFIDIYGLQNELTPEVEDKDVTVRRADLQRDIKSLISYAVGCMFGRYSLDVLGLVYAGGEWDATKYTTFQPDKDAIIPICDDEYFDDDIVGRFVEFIKIVYGEETLEENLKFIADALGGKGTSREVIRNYFINDFYADHLKMYQKRPIYWLFDSGKKNGFKCLIYMHRYQPDMIARIRTDYVHEQQERYRTAIEEIENRIDSVSGSEKVKLSKKLSTLRVQDEEIHSYEEKIHHLADQMISIDLDDGVKHNYELFKDVLAKIK